MSLRKLAIGCVFALVLCASASWAGIATYQLDGGTSVPAPISYWLSGNATSVTIDIMSSSNAVAYTFPTITGTNAEVGFHSNVVTWNGQSNTGGSVPSGNYKIRATVVTPSDTAVANMPVVWGVTPSAAAVYGIAMNNNPNSALYGRVYVGLFNATTLGAPGIYEYNPDGTLCGSLPSPTEGWGTNGPWGLCVDADDHVYATSKTNKQLYKYTWDGSVWTMTNPCAIGEGDKQLGCNFSSGANLRLVDIYSNNTYASRLWLGASETPSSFTNIGGDKSSSSVPDLFMQPAVDAIGNIYVAGYAWSGTILGCVSVWNQSGTAASSPNRNTALSQAMGLAITPDDSTMWLARLPSAYASAPEKSVIYKFPKSEAMTITATSPNMTKYTALANSQKPRFISCDVSGNLAVASGTNYNNAGLWFGVVREPSLTPISEQRVGRNQIYFSSGSGGDVSPEFISASAVPAIVEHGSSTLINVTAKDLDSVASGADDIASCKFFCPALGYGTVGNPVTGTAMTKLTSPDANKQNTYCLTINTPANTPTGTITAEVYVYDIDGGVTSGHGTIAFTIIGGTVANIAEAKADRDDDDDVTLLSAQLSAVPGGGVPTGIAYIEDTNRTNALRIKIASFPTGVGVGDMVLVTGKMATTGQGERYIDATAVKFNSDGEPLDALGMNNRDSSATNVLGLFVKIWGEVASVGVDSYVITDGSPVSIKVICGTLSKPEQYSQVSVQGVISKDSSGPVLYINGE